MAAYLKSRFAYYIAVLPATYGYLNNILSNLKFEKSSSIPVAPSSIKTHFRNWKLFQKSVLISCN
jgi:hypothetical protein